MPNGNQVSPNTRGGFGSLQVNVFLNSIALPAEGANVTISEAGTDQVIEELKTNSLGQLPAITLPTPPLEFSFDPERPRPFNQYDLVVSLSDFSTVSIQNVQVYPDSTAIQRVVMRPVSQMVTIPYPTLWGNFPPKIPEAAIKKLPLPTDFVVLPKPVIPEFIVVHAGAPSDTSAPNYTVGFRDYVKNVASSEIYSTWSREAIKANVLAIQSFVLNRVYTEWYRGKGFDFTITNSTAYDQAFTYGRNIFKDISDVVDELFTTYISKPDILQPLFTQYSDGRRVVREGWLSQWGSQELAANQSYNMLQILKNYYGYDIVLKQAEKVQGIPLSFPGTTLKVGSTGESVKTIQRQLNAISNNFPAIPKLVVDGSYGESTKAAVTKFQEVFGLPVTGEVNFPTWYEISDVFVSVEKLA
jgi:hypothetical protein